MEGRVIKSRLALMGKTQRWLVGELAKRYGINTTPQELNNIFAGRRFGRKAETVMAAAYEIVSGE